MRISNPSQEAVHEKVMDIFRKTLGDIHNIKFFSWLYSCTYLMSPEISAYRRLADVPFDPWKDIRYLFFDDVSMQLVDEKELAGYPGFFYSDYPLKDLYKDFFGKEFIMEMIDNGKDPYESYIGVIDLKEEVYLRVNGKGDTYIYNPNNLKDVDPVWNRRWFVNSTK
ncbi:MAG TPA: hypothetical protein PK563_11900 [Tenuifilaceae bacterium]|nr:hypothetical protein [Tenuifilaceae bacterium]